MKEGDNIMFNDYGDLGQMVGMKPPPPAKHVDAIEKPIVIKFRNPSMGNWVRLTIQYNSRARVDPFVLHYEGYRTQPYRTKPYRIQPPNRYSTLMGALGAAQTYILNWSTQ